jgi:glycine cleavage system H protein
LGAPNDRKYTHSHEWIKFDGEHASVGLSAFAISAIKDLVFLELPSMGKELEQGKPFGVVESVKAVFDLYAPVAGTVVAVNSAIQDDLDSLAKEPYEKGWLIKLKTNHVPSAGDHLMEAAAYDKFCAEDHH